MCAMMTKLRMCCCSTRPVERLTRGLIVSWFVLVAACQAPTPLPTTVAPTAAPPLGTARTDVLNSANAAFDKGDLTNAASLYERVLNTPTTGESATTTAAINQFAHFRDMVTLLAAGNEDGARAQ